MRVSCLFIANYNSLAQLVPFFATAYMKMAFNKKYQQLNLFYESFYDLRIDLEHAYTAVIAGADGLTSTQFSFSNVQLFYDVITLEDGEAKSIIMSSIIS
jgi:hypothetical protein